jgi:hypothetical protein
MNELLLHLLNPGQVSEGWKDSPELKEIIICNNFSKVPFTFRLSLLRFDANVRRCQPYHREQLSHLSE